MNKNLLSSCIPARAFSRTIKYLTNSFGKCFNQRLFFDGLVGLKMLLALLISLISISFVDAQSVKTSTPGSYTYIVPAGVTSLTVEVWGAGGRGGSRSTAGRGGGGGGGGYSRSTVTVTPGNSYTYVVGAGSTSTAAGGSSSFGGTTVVALGGSSALLDSETGGTGAATGTGNSVFSGGNGSTRTSSTNGGGGGASAGPAGNGASVGNATAGATAANGAGSGGAGFTGTATGNGNAGATPGGGGGGAYSNGTAATGGKGGDGQVAIYPPSSSPLYGSGSRDLYPLGVSGKRAYLVSSYQLTSTNSWPFQTRGSHKVYAKVGETIYVGSSAQGVGTGTINLFAPGVTPNATRSNPSFTSGTSTTIGLIPDRARELAGPSPNSGGYTPYTHTVTAAEGDGIWEVDFISPDVTATANPSPDNIAADASWTQSTTQALIAAWDVSVRNTANTAFIQGRAYTNVFNGHLIAEFNNTTANPAGFYGNFYVVTKDGYSYLVKNNGQIGVGFTFFVNNKGFTTGAGGAGTPTYKSLNYSTDPPIKNPTTADDVQNITHKLFYGKPGADLPENAILNGSSVWLKTAVPTPPTVTGFGFKGVEGSGSNISSKGAYINFTSNVNGTYKITIPGSGNFVDRVLAGTSTVGPNQVYWDGKAGTSAADPITPGNPVPPGTTVNNIRVQLFGAEVHFPFIDVEINKNGVIIQQLSTDGNYTELAGKDIVYWNDSDVTLTANAAPASAANPNATPPNQNYVLGSNGVSSNSNGHKWGRYSNDTPAGTGGNEWGNERSIDTYSFVAGVETVQSVSVTISQADLSVTGITTSSPTTVQVGTDVTYSMVVRNDGPSDVTSAPFKFVVPTGYEIISVNAPTLSSGSSVQAGAAISSDKLTYNSQLNLLNQGTATYSIVVRPVAANTAGQNISVEASILRPADVTDPDATSPTTTGTPTDPHLECKNGTATENCNNIKYNSSIAVVAPISNNTISADQTICSGSTPVALTATTPTGGSGTYSYLWQQSTNGGTTWVSALGTNNTPGYTPPALTQTTQYRRVVTASVTGSNTSNVVVITVNPIATLVLTSGTASQTICSGSSIGNIVYTYGGGASGATVTGLNASYYTINTTNKTITISGAVPATANYTVSTTGSVAPCTDPTLSGTITVNPIATLALTSGTASQTICSGSSIGNIVYTYGGGATGATVTGLTATYYTINTTNKTVTISGAVPATASYTVSTTGSVAPCTDPTLSGTITVNPIATLALTSGTASQTICSGSSIGNIVYTYGGGATGATVTGLNASYYTVNTTNKTVTISGAVPATANYTVSTTGSVAPCTDPTLSGTITVNPIATLVLTSGTASQTICSGSSIGNIVYTYGGGATGATVTGLTASYYTINTTNKTVTISGAVPATANYTVSTTGSVAPCTDPTLSGTITVNPIATLVLTSGTASQTICSGSSIGNIVYTYGGGATGATVTGLTASYYTINTTNKTVTISGAVPATANYTVSTTGSVAPCTNPTLSGTITVNPIATLVLTSGTASQTICSGSSIGNIVYTYGGGASGATVTGLNASYYTVNTTNKTVTISGAVPATSNYTVSTTGSAAPCTDPTLSGTITVNPIATLVLTSGTASQTICSGSSIGNIVYTYGGGASGATVTGLNASYYTVNTTNKTVTISGAVPATSNYTVSTTGSVAPCTDPTLSGTITVNPIATLVLTSGTASQTICSGSSIGNIVYTYGGGATGATVTGLTASYYTINTTNKTVTISGAVPATANYTVSTTGSVAPCTNPTLSGTITVNPLANATIAGTTTVNIGAANPNVTFTATAGTAPFVFTYNINGGTNATLNSSTTTATVAQSTAVPGVFTYNLVSISDANGCSRAINGQSATITVKPTGVNDNFSTSINTLKNLDVKANDGTAVSGATVNIVTAPANGTAVVQANGTVNYTPANGFKGTSTFTYTLTLNGVTSDPITVTVNVANGAILAQNDAGSQNGTTGGSAIASVLTNDTYNGVANSATAANVTITQNTNNSAGKVTLNTTTGEVTVAAGTPVGIYTINYTITDKLDATLTSSADAVVTITNGTITAFDDAGTQNGTTGGTAIANILANDTYNGVANAATTSNVTITENTNNSNGKVTLNASTGAVTVATGTPVGTYTINYTITDKLDANKKSSANALVTITNGTITAFDDAGTQNGTTGGPAIANILANDTYNGVANAATTSNVTITENTNNSNGKVTLNASTGAVTVAAGTPVGTYTINYTITDKLDANKKSSANAVVTVTNGTITAVADAGTQNGTAGGTAIANILANDTYNGVANAATTSNVTITQNTDNSAGKVTLNTTTGEVTVAAGTPVGTYTINYTITDKLDANKSSSANAVVTVTNGTITAFDDAGTQNGTTGGIAIANILANDTYNGVASAASVSNVTISQNSNSSTNNQVSLDPATGAISVAAGTPVGTYTINYTITDKLDANKKSSANAVVTVTNGTITAVADAGTQNGTTGGTAITSVLTNDTYNGIANSATAANVTITQNTNNSAGKVTLNTTTGEITVAPNTPVGTYTINYIITDKLDVTKSSSANAVVTVTNGTILAQNDSGTQNATTGGTAIANILANDTYNGVANTATTSNVTITENTNNSNGKVTLNAATGAVSVAAGTPVGTYTINYTITDKLDITKSSSANAVVTVTNGTLLAKDDTGTSGTSGGNAVANILINDTYNGVDNAATTSSVTIKEITNNSAGKVTLNLSTGSVDVAANTPAGVYVIEYQIIDKLDVNKTSNAKITVTVSSANILAKNDSGSIGGLLGGAAINNVLVNDEVNGGQQATLSNVKLEQVSTDNNRVNLDITTGKINVDPKTPAGTYTVTYKITDLLDASKVSQAVATVLVNAPVMVANADNGSVNGFTGGVALTNVLANDTYDGNPATLNDVTLDFVSSSDPKVKLNTTNGNVTVDPNTPAGTYTLTYKITDKLNPTLSKTAVVTITVGLPTMVAVDDAGTVNGLTGGTGIANVLLNDTYNGNTATLNEVSLAQISTSNANVHLDPATGKVIVDARTPAGTYTVVYEITDLVNPTQKKRANAVVTVEAPEMIANADNGTVNSYTGGTAVNNVLANDKYNGNTATLTDVTLAQVSTSNPNVTLDVT
ncbi:Ig-like domain-containing protein, partial [Pedobacter jeongneungensis]|uniref:Ig-like domain-containing protein n=1 Tax=Pedobacter jeongneungensis TaxID=947309 RepID=UPI00046869BA